MFDVSNYSGKPKIWWFKKNMFWWDERWKFVGLEPKMYSFLMIAVSIEKVRWKKEGYE